MIKYNGILKTNSLKMEKEINTLKNKKENLERRIQIAMGAGFDSSSYEKELETVSLKLKVYNNIF